MADNDELSELEQEFSTSWDYIEQFYKGLITTKSWESLTPILGLIAEMRKRGYERQVRAGQSMWWFLLSRSRKHGLRRGQHSIKINVIEGKGMGITYFQPPNPKIEVIQTEIEITPEVEALLKRLLAHPID